MMNMKKLLALLLAIVLVMGMFPMGAMAEETEPELCTCGLVLNHDGECQSQEPAPQNLEEPELCTCGLEKGHEGECKTAEPEYCDCGLTKGHEGECQKTEPEYCDCGLTKGHEGECKTAEPEYCDCGLEKGHEGDCKTAEPEYCDCGLTKGHEGECQKVEQTKCGICGGEHADVACNYCLSCKTDRSECIVCTECEMHAGDHRIDCSKREPIMMAPAPEEETLYEKLMAMDDIDAMYMELLDRMENDPNSLWELSLEEVQDIYALVKELDPSEEYEYHADLVDTLQLLAGEYDLNGAETLVTKITDDYTFTQNYKIDSPVTIKNEDTGGEANWTFNGGTLTINDTVTIPNGQRLDLLVANGKSGKIIAGSQLGNKPMFKLEGNAWLKIARTNDNDGQNHGSIEINGGTIEVGSGTSLYMEDIKTVSGNAKWNIASGGNLHILGDVPVSGSLTISGTANIVRSYTDGVMFPVSDGGILKIEGASKDSIVIDGKGVEAKGSVINLVYNGNPAFTSKTGMISLKNVKFANHISTSGSACVNLAGYSTSELTIDGCTFYNSKSVSGAAIYFNGYARSNATIKNSLFDSCTTEEGGAIRTNGAGGVYALVEQCVFKNNKGTNASSHGGAIYWNACGIRADGQTAKMDIYDCQFINNSVNDYAGAVFNESFMDITTRYSSGFTMSETTPGSIKGTLITGNRAKYGGGVQVPTYGGGMEPHNGVGAKLTLQTGVFIIGNTAEYGGGLAMRVGKGTIGDTAEDIASVEFEINLEGAVIRDNTATQMGGGIYLDRMLDYDLYPSTVNLKSGTISGNGAPKGGGICVYNENNAPSTKRNEVNVGSANGVLLVENNKATGASGLGGAVYISYGNVNMVNGTVRDNTAANGGAICVDNGQFTISGGTLISNDASVNGGAAYVAGGNVTVTGGAISENTAEDGAGIYVSGGNFEMSNGSISSNTASGNGAAAYVTGGNFNMSGGDMTKNNATNGGAVYADGGEVMIAHGSLNENEATKGGAVYMAGTSEAAGKLTMESGEMKKNHAADDGGAIYAEYGVITIGLQYCVGLDDNSLHIAKGAGRHHPLIQENKAEDCGGGIAIANEGEVRFYCGSIDPNEALYKGVGNNVFMQGGNFYLYSGAKVGTPGDPDLVIVGGEIHNESAADARIEIQYYKTNTATSHDKVGFGEENQWMNLPDAEYFWDVDEGYRFFGWTPYGGASAITQVRNKNQYKESGKSVMITDKEVEGTAQRTYDGIADNTMHLYALWAREVSRITYVDGMTFDVIDNKEPDDYNIRETAYTLEIDRVLKPGYILTGWYIYQNLNQNANWSDGDLSYEPVYENGYVPTYTGSVTPANDSKDNYQKLDFEQLQFIPANANEVATLNVDALTFGDITLIAKFEPAYTSLRISKSGCTDADQSFIFNISGQPNNQNLAPVNMNVVIQGNGFVQIKELPVGTYTVKEITGWSWRYEVHSDNAGFGADPAIQTVSALDPMVDYAAYFLNDRENPYWLSGDSYKENNWSIFQ